LSDESPDVVTSEPSAPAPAPDAPASAAPDRPAEPAQSASATQDEGKQTLLEAVLEAMPEKASRPDPDIVQLPGVTSDAASEKPDQEKADESESPEDRALAKDELDPRWSERTKTRFQRLLAERDSYRTDAEVAIGFRKFLADNGIDRPGLEVMLDITTALRRGDFQTFHAGIMPYVELAEQALGLRVAPDIQRDVQTGHMTSEAAARMTQERIQRQLAEGRAQDYERGQQQQVAQRQSAELRNALAGAVNQWEAQTAKTDPDFALKQRAAKDIVWSVLRESGQPATPQQAVLVAQEAYRRAGEHLRAAQPAPRATHAVPSSAHRSNGAMAAPKTLMEAALQGLARSRA